VGSGAEAQSLAGKGWLDPVGVSPVGDRRREVGPRQRGKGLTRPRSATAAEDRVRLLIDLIDASSGSSCCAQAANPEQQERVRHESVGGNDCPTLLVEYRHSS